jgi:hypothetical protein
MCVGTISFMDKYLGVRDLKGANILNVTSYILVVYRVSEEREASIFLGCMLFRNFGKVLSYYATFHRRRKLALSSH